jgi:hypothetical protein
MKPRPEDEPLVIELFQWNLAMLIAAILFGILSCVVFGSTFILSGSIWWGVSKACDVSYFYNEAAELNPLNKGKRIR